MSHRSTQVDSDQSDRALRIQRVVDDCLAEQFLRRRQAACDDGFVVMGLHWFARGLEVEPSGHDELRTVIAENLTQWGRFGISECVSYFSSDRYAGLAAGEEPGTTELPWELLFTRRVQLDTIRPHFLRTDLPC